MGAADHQARFVVARGTARCGGWPAGFMANDLPWGVTLFGRAFTDQYLLSLADAVQRQSGLPLVGEHSLPAAGVRSAKRPLVARYILVPRFAVWGWWVARRADHGLHVLAQVHPLCRAKLANAANSAGIRVTERHCVSTAHGPLDPTVDPP